MFDVCIRACKGIEGIKFFIEGRMSVNDFEIVARIRVDDWPALTGAK